MGRPLHYALGLSLCFYGCSGALWQHATAGYGADLGGDRRPSVVVDAESGLAANGPVGVSMNLHGRFGDGLVQVAPSFSARAIALARVAPFVGAGTRVLSLESNRGALGFGMFSPFLEAGGLFMLSSRSLTVSQGQTRGGAGMVFVAHAQIGYDVRFTHQDNSVWFSVSLGLGFFTFQGS